MTNPTMKAIRIRKIGEAVLETAPIPQLRDDYILVKIKAVALKPGDWKLIDYLSSPGLTVGCDYSGIMEKVGPSVKKDIRPGDRVAGFIYGCNSSHPALLEDPDQNVRRSAIDTLGKQATLPDSILHSVIALLQDSHPPTRMAAGKLLREQTFLSDILLYGILAKLNHHDWFIRGVFIETLCRQPGLPGGPMETILAHLNDTAGSVRRLPSKD